MRRADGIIPPIVLEPRDEVPLYLQIYEGLREAIVRGAITAGTRLPSTRGLARDMEVSRTTAIQAYRQLETEGYVDSTVGSGTYVTHDLPDRVLAAGVSVSSNGSAVATLPDRPALSTRSRRILDLMPGSTHLHGVVPFLPGVPALDKFPYKTWRRLEREVRSPTSELGPGEPAGHPRLRQAITAHVAATRAIRCHPDQVVVTTGIQEAFAILGEILFDPGDHVLVEEPGCRAATSAFEAMGAEVQPALVDAGGMDVRRGLDLCPDARLALVTPSNQFPMGALLTMERRRELLAWARDTGAWIVEDDHGCEYRFRGTPLPAIRSLEGAEASTVYVNTFSKLLFPALSLGFVILPDSLVEPFVAAQAIRDYVPPLLPQLTLTRFMDEGHLPRHVRRMRQIYEERAAALRAELIHRLSHYLDVPPVESGMHLLAWLPKGIDDQEVSDRAARHGVRAPALSQFRRVPSPQGALVLGFGGTPVSRLADPVERLSKAFA